jgi:hypothetical protein
LQSPPEPPRQNGRRGKTSDLWKGLPKR